MKSEIMTLDAKKGGDIELVDSIFALEVRRDILHRVVTWQLAKRRAGTHKIKLRAEIARTKKKMYRQKGTGGARHGARSAAQFVGGAKVFGPVVRSHAFKLPKKVRALGLRHALSARAHAGSLIVIDDAKLSAPKTKDLRSKLQKLGAEHALVITGESVDENFKRAVANIPNVDVLPSVGANVYDIMRRKTLVLTKDAVAQLEARLK
mgnify:CR=1 FL=1